MTDQVRIAQLETTINSAMAELQALKAGRTAPPPMPPKDEGGVRIIPVLDERTDLPNLKELERLFAAVKPLAPWPLDVKYDEHKPFRGFCACFRWLSNKGRADHPNPRFALSFWLDNCKTWLRDRNAMASDIDATTLVLATYAQGDIGFVPANPTVGHTWELALAEHGGRKASPDG